MRVIMMNKETGALYIVRPSWECLSSSQKEYVLDSLYCNGTFLITGWLVTNEHAVTLKVPLNFNCDNSFEEIGML